MSMMWLSGELGKSEDPHDQMMSDVLKAFVKARGEDIPLPEDTLTPPTVPVVGSPGLLGDLASKHLVLRTQDTEMLAADPEELGEKVANLEALNTTTEALIRLYTELFSSLVPVSGNDRSRITNKIKVGKPKQGVWRLEEVRDDLRLGYKLDVNYTQGETTNPLDSVEATITSQHDIQQSWFRPPELLVQYTQLDGLKSNDVAKIVLNWWRSEPEALLKLVDGTFLGQFIDESFIIEDVNVSMSQVIFDFTDKEPCLRISQILGHSSVNNIKLESSYIFRPVKNRFTRQFGNTALHEKHGVSMETELSAGAFITLVSDALALLPVADVNMLLGTNSEH